MSLSADDNRLAAGIYQSYRGNYRELKSYQKAEVIFDITFFFAHKFLGKGDRTVDQMVQAARSGKQNIAEGCAAGATRPETEIQLLNVAKASMKELLEDYKDYLRVRAVPEWPKGSRENEYMRKLGTEHNDDSAYFQALIKTRPPETIANMAIVLLHQLDYLLFSQIKAAASSAAKGKPLAARVRASEESAWMARFRALGAEFEERRKALPPGDFIAARKLEAERQAAYWRLKLEQPRSMQR